MNKSGELEPLVMLKSKIEREIDAQYLDSAKIFKKFGWQPKINLDEGLSRTINWYQSNLDKIS